ncbi:hypothetical protein GQ457_18G018140 [Hibiscus cannabinus]
MEECSLLELHLLGGPFSWINQRSDEEAIMEKLDRFLFNLAWSEMFNKATGFLEPAIGSDHCPLVCNFYGSSRRRKRDFRFESKWLLEDECKQVVNNAWKLSRGMTESGNVCKKLKRTRFKLLRWCKDKYGKQKNNTEALYKKIETIQKLQHSKIGKKCKLESKWP